MAILLSPDYSIGQRQVSVAASALPALALANLDNLMY